MPQNNELPRLDQTLEKTGDFFQENPGATRRLILTLGGISLLLLKFAPIIIPLFQSEPDELSSLEWLWQNQELGTPEPILNRVNDYTALINATRHLETITISSSTAWDKLEEKHHPQLLNQYLFTFLFMSEKDYSAYEASLVNTTDWYQTPEPEGKTRANLTIHIPSFPNDFLLFPDNEKIAHLNALEIGISALLYDVFKQAVSTPPEQYQPPTSNSDNVTTLVDQITNNHLPNLISLSLSPAFQPHSP